MTPETADILARVGGNAGELTITLGAVLTTPSHGTFKGRPNISVSTIEARFRDERAWVSSAGARELVKLGARVVDGLNVDDVIAHVERDTTTHFGRA